MSISATDGKELVNSIGPLGNIGSPVGHFEGTEHLPEMLKKTAQNLTEKEIDRLILSMVEESRAMDQNVP